MNLQELQENKKTRIVKRALREHYEMNIDFDKLSLSKTQSLLTKVKGLLKETNKSSKSYDNHQNSAYLKLVMMEQALSDRINDLRNPNTKIVVENEEVLKSQVILAAQDMIDNIQKMLEQVSKMNVEELNAVTNGMKNEFGTVEGDNFNKSVSDSLMTLQTALTTAKDSISSALGAVTGEAPAAPDAMGGDIGAEMGAEVDAEMPPTDMPAELPTEEPELATEPADVTGAGRERR